MDDDIDGKPIGLEPLDNRSLALVADYDDEEDIDGKPISAPAAPVIDDSVDGRPFRVQQEGKSSTESMFVSERRFSSSSSSLSRRGGRVGLVVSCETSLCGHEMGVHRSNASGCAG